MVSIHPFPHLASLSNRPIQKLLKTAATVARQHLDNTKGFQKNLLQVIFFIASKRRTCPRGSSGESLYWDNIWYWLTSCMEDSQGTHNKGCLTISLHTVRDACYSYVWQHLPKASSEPKGKWYKQRGKNSSIQQLVCTSESLLINTTIHLCL